MSLCGRESVFGISTVAWLAGLLLAGQGCRIAPADTVALWLFDEQVGIYPSCVLGDAESQKFPLVLGPGGQIMPGRFGNALEPSAQPDIAYPPERYAPDGDDPGRARQPLTWATANFCALMTRGENHLRKEVGFANPVRSRLNLAAFDWTVEFWYLPTTPAGDAGVVFELGRGPRGRGEQITQLILNSDSRGFTLVNQPAGIRLRIPSQPAALDPNDAEWHHLAFVYDAASGQLRHYVDGRPQPLPDPCVLQPLEEGSGDYFCVGRDGDWRRPLPGRMDELRFSDSQVYREAFDPPGTFSALYGPDYEPAPLEQGPPLLFCTDASRDAVVALGGRKHLFIDDALVADAENIQFRVHPPRLAERISDDVNGHLTLYEGADGLIRMYYQGPRKSLAVMTSRDGVHWDKPDLGNAYRGARNVVIEDPVGLGTVFVDPNAPPQEHVKYFSGYRGRGFFVYSSPDGFAFQRNETSALPQRAASQSIVFYDDQRQVYAGYHRSDMAKTVGGKTMRTFVMTETRDVLRPWPFRRVSQHEQRAVAQTRRLSKIDPWYTDNGPLTPPGFGVEYPTVFAPVEGLDPVGTDIYVPKCLKYPWAPDTYLAFPIVYFHYHGDGPETRRVLGLRERGRGSGATETQVAVSRNGIDWKRYPRPVYIGNGRHGDRDIHMAYAAHGMVRRGTEIWQYYLGGEQYHSSWTGKRRPSLYRVIQRADGFVSAEAPYTGGTLTTRPLTFAGNRLVLNIDTDAAGFAQVGLTDSDGRPLPGFGLDECVYINGDFIGAEVEWMDRGTDVGSLAGQTVRLVFRMRGSRLYGLQFVTR